MGHDGASDRDPDPSSSAFFDEKYLAANDPWSFERDPYELGRYREVVSHVDPARHRVVFEPGCSIGVLTEMLGERCDVVHASDLSAVAVARARARCARLPGVSVTVGDLSAPPADRYDLIVLSEVGYYLDLDAWRRAAETLSARVTPSGRIVAAHWIGRSADHRLHGDEVHEVLAEVLASWRHHRHQVHLDAVHDGYRLDVWDRP